MNDMKHYEHLLKIQKLKCHCLYATWTYMVLQQCPSIVKGQQLHLEPIFPSNINLKSGKYTLNI